MQNGGNSFSLDFSNLNSFNFFVRLSMFDCDKLVFSQTISVFIFFFVFFLLSTTQHVWRRLQHTQTARSFKAINCRARYLKRTFRQSNQLYRMLRQLFRLLRRCNNQFLTFNFNTPFECEMRFQMNLKLKMNIGIKSAFAAAGTAVLLFKTRHCNLGHQNLGVWRLKLSFC